MTDIKIAPKSIVSQIYKFILLLLDCLLIIFPKMEKNVNSKNENKKILNINF